jgi:Sel1 repeat
MLIYGRPDLPKDHKRAFELAAAGAAIGCAQSKGALGDCYVDGVGVAKDVGKGLALGRESAAAGSCFGQCVVGWCYRNGVGVAQDYAEALRLYSLAAAQGYAVAQNNLGLMFQNGLGVAQDYAEALRLYSLAAAQGYAIAQNNLGRMFRDGLGVAQDRTEVIRWFRRAVIWFKSHPALSLARPDPAFVAELTAHPLYCWASQSSVKRWEVMFFCRLRRERTRSSGMCTAPTSVCRSGGLCLPELHCASYLSLG